MSSPKPLPEAFWPTIKQAIDKGANTNSDNQAITPQCPICMESLPVRSFPTEGELDAEVLLCGHVLCKPCREQNEESDPRERCPLCRTTLFCSRCEAVAIPLTIPKNGEGSSLPPDIPEGTQDLCPDCLATVEFHRDVENGEWPHGLDDMEPGFVSLFYHVVDDIEKNGDVATEGRVQEAISDTIMQEFTNMMMSRRFVTLQRGSVYRQTNPWYAENKPREENLRIGVIQHNSSPGYSDSDDEGYENLPSYVPPPLPNSSVQGGARTAAAQTDNPNSGLQVQGMFPFIRAGLRRVMHPILGLRRGAATQTTTSAQDNETRISLFRDGLMDWYDLMGLEMGTPIPGELLPQLYEYLETRGVAFSPTAPDASQSLSSVGPPDDPAQPGNANRPSDVQDGIARPGAATQTSEAARRYHDRALIDEESDDDMAWVGSSQQEGSTVTTTTEVLQTVEVLQTAEVLPTSRVLPTSGMFPPAYVNERPIA